MKLYVHRRKDGTVASCHQEKQPGYAEEALDESDSALDHLLRPAGPTKADRLTARFKSDPEFAALCKRIAKAEGKSLTDLRDELAEDLT